MTPSPRMMVLFLAAAIALSPASGELRHHAHDAVGAENSHHHHHTHDGEAHAHEHHHHQDGESGGTDHHHDLSDLPPDGVKARWTAARRLTVAPVPMMPAPSVLCRSPLADRENLAREKPPPERVHRENLSIGIRTVILLV